MFPIKILVVDDDLPTLELMTEILTRLDVDVHAVEDSEEALSLVNLFRFDAIFLDLMMPKLDGYGLARAIRQSLCNQSSVIVFITANAEKTVIQNSFQAGGSLFLHKPIDRGRIRMLLNGAKGLILDTRRGLRRIPVAIKVTHRGNGRVVTTETCDLSERGMRIKGNDGAAVGQQLELSFRLPKQTKDITASGVVVGIEGENTRIHFSRIQATDRQRIRLFIDAEILQAREPSLAQQWASEDLHKR